MEPQSQPHSVLIKSNKEKIIENLIDFLFEEEYFLFGDIVINYILPSKNKKKYPLDINISVYSINESIEQIKAGLSFCFDIKINSINGRNDEQIHATLILTYKFANAIVMNINLFTGEYSVSDVNFDMDGVYMTDRKTIKLVDKLEVESFSELMNNINKKKFRILTKFSPPVGSRAQLGIPESSTKLIDFIKTMEEVTKMFNRGWKLDKQKLEEVFDPCLIHAVDRNNDNQKCELCDNKFHNYSLELYCCKKNICFNCSVEHVKARFNNSEIHCPYCRGDAFGWKTIKPIQPKEANESAQADLTDEDMPELEDVPALQEEMPPLVPDVAPTATNTRRRGRARSRPLSEAMAALSRLAAPRVAAE